MLLASLLFLCAGDRTWTSTQLGQVQRISHTTTHASAWYRARKADTNIYVRQLIEVSCVEPRTITTIAVQPVVAGKPGVLREDTRSAPAYVETRAQESLFDAVCR